MTAVVTGSAGLIGSECVRLLCGEGWKVVGIDNDLRAWLFGRDGSTGDVVRDLVARYPNYHHHAIDIRDRRAVFELVRDERPRLIIHAAAQPSHDKSASILCDDFDINAVGALNLLTAAREFVRDSPFCFASTNKVYGDRPNRIPLVEKETRWDYLDQIPGIAEDMPIDQCLHSPFGASKLAADILCQEYGRYFQMPVGIFRGGCLTGPRQSGVVLHGYLNYIVRCAVLGEPYRIYGHKGKQVRDQLHCNDVARLFLRFYQAPRCGEVYNIGGGRQNSISILETIHLLEECGHRLAHTYEEAPRLGDHICYITDLSKTQEHFPGWAPARDLRRIVDEIILWYATQPRS